MQPGQMDRKSESSTKIGKLYEELGIARALFTKLPFDRQMGFDLPAILRWSRVSGSIVREQVTIFTRLRGSVIV